ncbi:MAG: hypothetical protein IT303_09840 [Dehalococcoidia bacterium]|nr:hypothetical protein [Dehalococcoidia bacterium]
MDEETRQLLREVVDALDALLIATQLEGQAGLPGPDFALREAVRRVNRLRRSIKESDGAA